MEIELWTHVTGRAEVQHVPHDADHLVDVTVHLHGLPDGVFPGPHRVGQVLVDDDHIRLITVVASLDHPSSDQGHPEGLEHFGGARRRLIQ